VAFFEFWRGQLDGVQLNLNGLRFAVASRLGVGAVLFLDSGASDAQRSALRRIAGWILSLEATPLTGIYSSDINVDLRPNRLSGMVKGADVTVSATPLAGNDGTSSITVSHPWMFGAFSVTVSRKCMAHKLHVRVPGLSFDYSETNANDADFEFAPAHVR